MKNKVLAGLLFAALIFSGMNTFAADMKNSSGYITKEHTFTSKEENADCKEVFDKSITENGVRYELKDITYKVMSKKPATIKKEKEKIVLSDVLDPNASYEPAKTLMENGVTYTLESYEKTETKTETQKVNGFVDYSYHVDRQDVPEKKEFVAVNILSGKEESVLCELQGIEKAEQKWIDSSVNITFEDYDSDAFYWQGVEIPKNETNPLYGHEELLIRSIGEDPNTCRIRTISWSGNAYENQGAVCRDAVAEVQRLVQYYRASYVGEFAPGVCYQAVYKGIEEVESTEEFDYEILATANYKKSFSSIIMAGIGIFIILLLVILLIYILSRKKKNKEVEKQ